MLHLITSCLHDPEHVLPFCLGTACFWLSLNSISASTMPCERPSSRTASNAMVGKGARNDDASAKYCLSYFEFADV